MLLTITDASKILQISTVTIRRLIASRSIPHYRIGKLFRFKQTDLELWISEQAGGLDGKTRHREINRSKTTFKRGKCASIRGLKKKS